MANTLFGALSGIRPVNRGLIIHEIVGRAIPNIGRKPSYLSPFILHLYKHFDCITQEEEDRLTIAMEEVAYKIRKLAPESSTSSNPIIPDAPPSSPGSPASQRPPSSPPQSRRTLSPRLLPLLHNPSNLHIRKPEPAGIPFGGTWIRPAGRFRMLLSNKSTTT